MLTIDPQPVEELTERVESPVPEVMLADGSWRSLEGMSAEQLQALQWD